MHAGIRLPAGFLKVKTRRRFSLGTRDEVARFVAAREYAEMVIEVEPNVAAEVK